MSEKQVFPKLFIIFGLILVKVLVDKFEINTNSWFQNNGGFEHKFWSLKDATQLIMDYYPEYYDIFDMFQYNISKCDFFRYILMHKYGGVYVDYDFTCIKPIIELFEKAQALAIPTVMILKCGKCILTEEWQIHGKRFNVVGASGTLHNGILMSVPNPIMACAMHECGVSTNTRGDETIVFKTTGKNY